MAFDRYQTYVTFGGGLGSTGSFELWQCGIHLAYETNVLVPPLPTSTELESLYDVVEAYIGDSDTGVCNAASVSWVKAASLNLAGDYADEPVLYETMAPTFGNGGPPGTNPPQSALAVTLWSGGTLGRANYGRYYLPWANLTVSASTGRFVGAGSCATRSAAFIAAVNAEAATWAGVDDTVVVNMSSVGSGTTKVVTTVRVGDVKDTQRRRRNAIGEAYSAATV